MSTESQSDTPTPRTDLEIEHAIQYCTECDDLSKCSLSVGQAVGKGFAKRLERELAAAQAHIAELEAELESHAWEISPAMAQAKIDELNAKIERLEAKQPPAPKFLERPDAPGWWWVWSKTRKQWVVWIVSKPSFEDAGIYVRATPPQWTPSEEGAK
jgi:hypothetical protein